MLFTKMEQYENFFSLLIFLCLFCLVLVVKICDEELVLQANITCPVKTYFMT